MSTESIGAVRSSWASVALVYLGGLLQGLTLVSFPASSAVLKELQGLSDAQYGAIFLPQVALAVIGSIGGGSLAGKLGLKPLLVLALISNMLSQLLLAGSGVAAHPFAFLLVMVASAAVGMAFGLNGAPLNSFPPLFFPGRRDAAVIAIHSLLGLGLAVGPLIIAPFVSADAWVGFPLALAAVNLTAAVALIAVPLPRSAGAGGVATETRRELPAGTTLFWLFVAITVLYAFAEGTFANWAVIYLHEALAAPEATAGLAITVFWGALVVGRLAVSGLVLRVSTQAIWLILLGLMIVTFLVLPLAQDLQVGILLFGLAGLACSAFFPLTVTLISRAFPGHIEWASSMMIAALMVGVGLGSFVFGPLRDLLSFAQLYRVSAIYPGAALLLAFIAVRSGPCRQTLHEMWTGSRCR